MKTINKIKRYMTNCISIVIAAFVSIALSSCSSGNAKPELKVDGTHVIIEHMEYIPATITVEKGTTITWTNNQVIPHSVTSDITDMFDSETLHKGESFSYTFNNSGTFSYYCKHHSKMHGTVIVQGGLK
jgi:plastocyanin